MTFLSTNSDLLMSMLSLAIYYVVACIFSDPARSTSCNFEVTTVSMAVGSTVSTVNVYMQWDRDDWWFKLCAATTLFRRPMLKRSKASAVEWHSKTKRFSTTNYSFLVHLMRRPGGANCLVLPSLMSISSTLVNGVESGLSKSNTRSL